MSQLEQKALTATQTKQNAHKRILRDLREWKLHCEEVPVISAEPLEIDIFEWHANMFLSNGPLKGITFHLIIKFPENYPYDPPKISVMHYLSHPNVFASGSYGLASAVNSGYCICLDMLKSYTRSKQYEGWSSAYSIFSVLFQLQSFLFGDKADQDYGEAVDTKSYFERGQLRMLKESKQYKCVTCSHTYYQPWPGLSRNNLATRIQMEILAAKSQKVLAKDRKNVLVQQAKEWNNNNDQWKWTRNFQNTQQFTFKNNPKTKMNKNKNKNKKRKRKQQNNSNGSFLFPDKKKKSRRRGGKKNKRKYKQNGYNNNNNKMEEELVGIKQELDDNNNNDDEKEEVIKMITWKDLYHDVEVLIISYLRLKDVINMSRVCIRWKQNVKSTHIIEMHKFSCWYHRIDLGYADMMIKKSKTNENIKKQMKQLNNKNITNLNDVSIATEQLLKNEDISMLKNIVLGFGVTPEFYDNEAVFNGQFQNNEFVEYSNAANLQQSLNMEQSEWMKSIHFYDHSDAKQIWGEFTKLRIKHHHIEIEQIQKEEEELKKKQEQEKQKEIILKQNKNKQNIIRPIAAFVTRSMCKEPSYETALCIIPPSNLWNPIQNIRRDNDRAYKRWMPHINLSFPFINQKHFGVMRKHIENIIDSYNLYSFHMEMKEFSIFKHIQRKGQFALSQSNEKECIFLKPSISSNTPYLQTIYKSLKSVFPENVQKRNKYVPHLSVGQWSQKELMNKQKEFQTQWNRNRINISWECNFLYVISRSDKYEPFKVRHVIPLKQRIQKKQNGIINNNNKEAQHKEREEGEEKEEESMDEEKEEKFNERDMRFPRLSGCETTFDLLSLDAFKNYNIRNTVWKDMTFTHFVPIYIVKKHGKKSMVEFKKYCLKIYQTKNPNVSKFHPLMGVHLIAMIMNSLIVAVMKKYEEEDEIDNKNKNKNLHYSITLIECYFYYYHLLLALYEKYMNIIQPFIVRKCRNFILDKKFRQKRYVPNLGELMCYFTLRGGNVGWKSICDSLLDESFIRHVKWAILQYPELAEINNKTKKERISKTFRTSTTSLRLFMFQYFFLKNCCKIGESSPLQKLKEFNDNFGCPPSDLPEKFQKFVKKIYKVKNHNGYFKLIDKKGPSKSELLVWMEKALQESSIRGYHRNVYRMIEQKRSEKAVKKLKNSSFCSLCDGPCDNCAYCTTQGASRFTR